MHLSKLVEVEAAHVGWQPEENLRNEIIYTQVLQQRRSVLQLAVWRDSGCQVVREASKSGWRAPMGSGLQRLAVEYFSSRKMQGSEYGTTLISWR